jgi:plastocyanin
MRSARQARRLLASLMVPALAGACAEDTVSGDDGPPANPAAITVGNNFFSPTSTTIGLGTTVTWTWSPGAVAHNVTFGGGASSATQSTGTFQRTFDTMGSFGYLCTIHGAAMSGSINVVP